VYREISQDGILRSHLKVTLKHMMFITWWPAIIIKTSCWSQERDLF